MFRFRCIPLSIALALAGGATGPAPGPVPARVGGAAGSQPGLTLPRADGRPAPALARTGGATAPQPGSAPVQTAEAQPRPPLALAGGGAEAQPGLALANVYRGGVDVTRYWVSEKLDGVRARWDGAVLRSRRGNPFHAPPWFVEGFPDVLLDGELWAGRGTFERLSGTVRRAVPDDDAWRGVRFLVFDLPAHPADFNGRLRRLRELFASLRSPYIGLVEQFRVADHAALMAALDRVVAAGGEGLMLHDGNARYRSGRTDDLLKVKRYDDAEAVVVAHLPGRGRFAGLLGSLLVETPDGRRFRLGSGFSVEERRRPPPVGATVTYKYFGLTRNGIPRFASFLRVRRDP